MQIKLSTSPGHSILTPCQPVPALTLSLQASGRVATGAPILKSLVRLDPEKSRRKRDSNPGFSAPEADALTTRPTSGANEAIHVSDHCSTHLPIYSSIYLLTVSLRDLNPCSLPWICKEDDAQLKPSVYLTIAPPTYQSTHLSIH